MGVEVEVTGAFTSSGLTADRKRRLGLVLGGNTQSVGVALIAPCFVFFDLSMC